MTGDRPGNKIEGLIIRDVFAPIWLIKPEAARRTRQRIGAVLEWSNVKACSKRSVDARLAAFRTIEVGAA